MSGLVEGPTGDLARVGSQVQVWVGMSAAFVSYQAVKSSALRQKRTFASPNLSDRVGSEAELSKNGHRRSGLHFLGFYQNFFVSIMASVDP
ncbi:hypothetical protein ACCD06_19185 [Azospirillum sp. CT11-132]|uniref:hypothetical protein n=1 Tax=Azospirillum sp. CT11-132 TaxID=3396317 RepID=UPI0039A52F8B